MKRYIALILFLSISKSAFGCDLWIQKFPRDCSLQDRMEDVRRRFNSLGIDVDEINEYKALRFIDRTSWENAKSLHKPIKHIYSPAPATWNVWEKGIDNLFNNRALKNALFSRLTLNQQLFSDINRLLLEGVETDPWHFKAVHGKSAGEYRANIDIPIGFCAQGNDVVTLVRNYHGWIFNSEISMQFSQTSWETKAGKTLKHLVQQETGKSSNANFNSGMSVVAPGYSSAAVPETCKNETDKAIFVSYSPSYQVPEKIEWMRVFIKTNLAAYQNNQGIISPVELATIIQKWFVSIHPFADGNGRTSRAIQDLIMANFGLPFVSGGDLQNDALEGMGNYINQTYSVLDSTLKKLENCITEHAMQKVSWACKTTKELNH